MVFDDKVRVLDYNLLQIMVLDYNLFIQRDAIVQKTKIIFPYVSLFYNLCVISL